MENLADLQSLTPLTLDTTERVWHIPSSSETLNDQELFARVVQMVNESIEDGYDVEIGIGCDSQLGGMYFQFITVLCIWKKGKGGFYFYNIDMVSKKVFGKTNQKLRMFEEVSKSIALASDLETNTKIKATVHIDASNATKKEFTSAFSEQLKGYVISSGYEALIKPESYVSCAIADKHTKKFRKNKK